MVLPIIIGFGVTVIALTTRSGLRAWELYKLLSPLAIARMNNIKIIEPIHSVHERLYQSSQLNPGLKARLEQYQGGFYHNMTESEALMILDISPQNIQQLDETMLKRKHRNAMLQNHPDKGGSPYLAMKVNEAREVLSQSIMLRKR